MAALDAGGQMALDEAVLDCASAGSCFLRFYEWAGPAVTFGLAQPYALALAAASARGMASVPIVRRPTGGGVVFHDGDLTFSVVFPWERLSPAPAVYERMHGAIGEALASRGVETRLAPSSPAAAVDVCFTVPSPFDLLTAWDEKLLGGALRRRRGRGLYQGSLRPECCHLPPAGLREAVAEGVRRAWPGAWIERLDPAWEAEGLMLAPKYSSASWNRRR
ncbi:MAG: lipoate--protein ligase family protein [Elusimicrobia bacterium]|nr:lipoate--protein ligase family protein [Elusimicrobiota bacterium]